jgi:type I restriction enzyme S subunit
MAREMKDSGIPWIGEIPADWELKNIKALFSFGKGLPITKDNLCDSGVPVISYGQIHSKRNSGTHIVKDLIRYVSEEYINSNPDSFAHQGDFIFADTSEDLDGCGNCAYVDVDIPIFAGYHTIILRAKVQKSNQYFAYLFKSDMWRRQIRERVIGVKLFSISQKVLKKTSLIIPPQEIQCRIADYLNCKCAEIDAVLEKTRTSIEEYKKLRRAIITQAVTKGIRGDKPMKESGVEWIGSCPANWTIIRIKWLLEEGKDRSTEGTEEPLSMSQKYGILPTKEMDIVPNMASSFVGAKLVHKGDLVFNKLKAHLGVFAVSDYDGLVSPDYAVYRTTSLANAKYLEYLFKTPQYISEFKKKSTGIAAGLTRLYTEGLYSIFCALPPIEEQQEIVSYLQGETVAMDALIQKKEQFLAELETYKKSLIYEYVTGKKGG